MKKSFLSCFAIFLFLATIQLSALTFNPFQQAGRIKNETLFLTGNVVESRLLAELAQFYTKQPILLTDTDAQGESKAYYVAADSRATAISISQFLELVDFIHPNRVIVIGGNEILNRQLVLQVSEKYKTVVLDGGNWLNNAASLGELLSIKQLAPLYENYLTRLQKIAAEQAEQAAKN